MNDQIVNRHIARTLSKLEPFDLPEIAIDAIKSNMRWLAKDLTDDFNGDYYK